MPSLAHANHVMSSLATRDLKGDRSKKTVEDMRGLKGTNAWFPKKQTIF